MATILGITSKLVPHLSITLGAQEVVVEDLASAYSTLANFGTFREPYLIERITDADGNVVYEHEDDPRQVLNSQIAAAVVGSMKKVVSSAGTARRADIGRPQAGKTGTTTNSAAGSPASTTWTLKPRSWPFARAARTTPVRYLISCWPSRHSTPRAAVRSATRAR